jgi:transposase-like protein
MRCPECGVEDTTEIEIHLKEDETVQFYSCRRCEARWWKRDGDTIALDQVLDLAAKSKPQRSK